MFFFTVGIEVDAVSDSGSEGESLVCVEAWDNEKFDCLPQCDEVMYRLV